MRTYGLWGLVMSSALGIPVALAEGPEGIRLDLNSSSLSTQQRKDLTMQEFYFAFFEKRMEMCGVHANVERRVFSAISDCVSDETIEKLRVEYRNMKLSIEKSSPPKIDCNNDTDKKWIKTTSKVIDDQISVFARRCRQCLFCRF